MATYDLHPIDTKKSIKPLFTLLCFVYIVSDFYFEKNRKVQSEFHGLKHMS